MKEIINYYKKIRRVKNMIKKNKYLMYYDNAATATEELVNFWWFYDCNRWLFLDDSFFIVLERCVYNDTINKWFINKRLIY